MIFTFDSEPQFGYVDGGEPGLEASDETAFRLAGIPDDFAVAVFEPCRPAFVFDDAVTIICGNYLIENIGRFLAQFGALRENAILSIELHGAAVEIQRADVNGLAVDNDAFCMERGAGENGLLLGLDLVKFDPVSQEDFGDKYCNRRRC